MLSYLVHCANASNVLEPISYFEQGPKKLKFDAVLKNFLALHLARTFITVVTRTSHRSQLSCRL